MSDLHRATSVGDYQLSVWRVLLGLRPTAALSLLFAWRPCQIDIHEEGKFTDRPADVNWKRRGLRPQPEYSVISSEWPVEDGRRGGSLPGR